MSLLPLPCSSLSTPDSWVPQHLSLLGGPHLSALSSSSSTWMEDSQSANLSSGKDRKIGSHHSRVKTRLQRCSHVTSREPRRIVVTGVQLRTGSRRTHRRMPHPHSDQCGRATELGAARREEAEERRASSSSIVASPVRREDICAHTSIIYPQRMVTRV